MIIGIKNKISKEDEDVYEDYLLSRVREEVDAFWDEHGHPSSRDGADSVKEYVPGAVVFGLPPAVRPANDYRVRLETP